MPEPASDTRRFFMKIRKTSAHDGRTHQPTENQRLREQNRWRRAQGVYPRKASRGVKDNIALPTQNVLGRIQFDARNLAYQRNEYRQKMIFGIAEIGCRLSEEEFVLLYTRRAIVVVCGMRVVVGIIGFAMLNNRTQHHFVMMMRN